MGAYYGLEVDAPAERRPRGIARPWEALRRRPRAADAAIVGDAAASDPASGTVGAPVTGDADEAGRG